MFFFPCLTINIWDETERKYFFYKESKSLYHCTHHQHMSQNSTTENPPKDQPNWSLPPWCSHPTRSCLFGRTERHYQNTYDPRVPHSIRGIVLSSLSPVQWHNLTSSPHKQELSAIVESWENYLEPTWLLDTLKNTQKDFLVKRSYMCVSRQQGGFWHLLMVFWL